MAELIEKINNCYDNLTVGENLSGQNWKKKGMYKKITVVGMGYVGLPLAILLAEWYSVWGFEIDEKKWKW